MPIRFAINGLGRIGRALARIARERPGIEWVAANDPVPVEILARLLARDTVHGPFAGDVAVAPEGDALLVDGRRIPVFGEARPERIPWDGTGAQVVVEASGRFLARDEAARHLAPERGEGVGRVVLTANAPEADVTLCLGLNEGDYDPRRHRVVSNASCTTNCAAPMLAVLARRFGVRRALISTVHSYTVNQRLVDRPHADPRRARAAAVNIIPTATTAPEALGRVLPAVAGRVEGMAVRVPTPAVAMLDLVADLGTETSAETSAEAVREAFREAAAGPLGRVLAATDEELVSSDFVGSPMSVTVDLPLVQVAGGGLARVVGWYDNEWGYSHRLADLVALVGETADEPRETAAPAHAMRARTTSQPEGS